MSDLSDQVEAALEKATDNGTESEKAELVAVDETPVAQLPGFVAMHEYYKRRTVKAIRRAYLVDSGSKPFESTTNALERTMERGMREFISVVIECFADGIQMGQESSFSYRKYKMFDRLGDVFPTDGWREESSLIALRFMEDEDSRRVFHNYLLSSIGHLGAISGYVKAKSSEELDKIWDLWGMTLHSVTIGTYAAGNELGKIWRENDVLSGIMAATEREE